MNDKRGFSMGVDVSPASGFAKLPDLVTFDLCKAYPLPTGNLLLRNIRTGDRAMVQASVYGVLASCSQFSTLDEHINRIIEDHPGMQGQEGDIRGVLQSMLDSGIMMSAKKATNSLKKAGGDVLDDKPVVVIITWERPESLERLLNSIQANCNIGKFHQLYVVDDSRQAENINKNRELTAKFALEAKTPIQYFGQTEQQTLLQNLARQLPEHEEAIRFLADQSRWRDQWTSGLARNLALLLSCGRRLVMLDDDTICDVFDPGGLKPDITFSDSPREADFYKNEHEWYAQRIPLNPDPIDRHMQCLGLTFSEAVNVLGQNNLKPAGLANASALLMNELHAESPVLITECGSFGCPGTDTNTWLPDMAPASIDKMLTSAEKLSNAMNIRMVWAGRHQPHFSPRPNMSQITGFDNRQMLPPYFPILRGEDRLFGYSVDFIFPSAVTLDYPWAIPHLPMPQREWRDEDRDFTPGDAFPLFFTDQVLDSKLACHAGEPQERLAALSSYFYDLAATPDDSLNETYRDSALQNITLQLNKLSGQLEGAESAPAQWREYLEQGIGQLGKGFERASQENYPVKGLPPSMEGAELIAFWKKNWAGFAAALKAWPEIREAAADIMDQPGPG